jgi:hypothetical protein
MQQHQLPLLHLRCRLQFHTMPMGNSMPVASPSPASTSAFVDARSVPNATMETIIPQVSQALPIAFGQEEITLRKQIATKVLITMGAQIMHFEGDIDPKTGCIDVDWKFEPFQKEDIFGHPSSCCKKATDLTDETRIKSHAVIRVYTHHVNECDGSKFSYLLGCEAIDLCALMQHSLDLNFGKINASECREYDFPIRTNFCNTFVLCTVLPLETKPGLKQMQGMQQQLDLFRGGIAAYEKEQMLATKEGRDPVHVHHVFMPSVLR